MSHEQQYLDFCFGLQAYRRHSERDACDLFGAMGLNAWPLPHQIANVHRVLTAPMVRHLLADEVGLGKTVQALMILNALKLQREGFRSLIVVPNTLMEQWRNECMGRAHEAPVSGSERFDGDGERSIRLAWPKVIARASEIDPERYDLLVVDEFHSLTKTLQERISDTAPAFEHLLLLSATPPFQDPGRADALLRMLEPGWASRFGAEVGATLRGAGDREKAVASLLEEQATERGWGRFGGPPPSPRAAAMAWCTHRRVVRTRREDWRRFLPLREHRALTVEPTVPEIARQRMMWKYFTHVQDLSREFELDRLAQRVIRSPSSLQQRVTYLLGHGHERMGILRKVDALLKRDRGDSRFEALCDLLADIWRREPEARVLIAAGDNLTVDFLADALPRTLDRVGPKGSEREIVTASARNQPSSALDFDDPSGEDEIKRAALAFSSGEANVMLAADIGSLGLNLQQTRHFILYSVPWDPQQIEQWLGRADRLGNTAACSTDGDPLPILVYTIVQRGLVDERVLRVIEASGALERSIAGDGQLVSELKRAILAAGLEGLGADWREVEELARGISGQRVDAERRGALLREHLPWDPDRARALADQISERAPLHPVIGRGQGELRGFKERERAIEGWLRSMRSADVYEYRYLKKYDCSTLRCASSGRVPGSRGHDQVGRLDRDLFGERGQPANFISRRARLGERARAEVRFPSDTRPLHFLSHGGRLHEELIRLWKWRLDQQGVSVARIRLPPDHPAHALKGRSVLVVFWVADPVGAMPVPDEAVRAACADGSHSDDEIEAALAHAATRSGREADERFVRSLFEPDLIVQGAVVGRHFELIEDELLSALLDPGKDVESSSLERSMVPSPEDLRSAEEVMIRSMRRRVSESWSPRLPEARERIEERKYLLHCATLDEQKASRDREKALERDLAAEEAVETTRASRARLTRLRNRIQKVKANRGAAELAGRARALWLDRALECVRASPVDVTGRGVFRVV